MVRDVLRDLPFAEIDPRAMITMVRDTFATTLFADKPCPVVRDVSRQPFCHDLVVRDVSCDLPLDQNGLRAITGGPLCLA